MKQYQLARMIDCGVPASLFAPAISLEQATYDVFSHLTDLMFDYRTKRLITNVVWMGFLSEISPCDIEAAIRGLWAEL